MVIVRVMRRKQRFSLFFAQPSFHIFSLVITIRFRLWPTSACASWARAGMGQDWSLRPVRDALTRIAWEVPVGDSVLNTLDLERVRNASDIGQYESST